MDSDLTSSGALARDRGKLDQNLGIVLVGGPQLYRKSLRLALEVTDAGFRITDEESMADAERRLAHDVSVAILLASGNCSAGDCGACLGAVRRLSEQCHIGAVLLVCSGVPCPDKRLALASGVTGMETPEVSVECLASLVRVLAAGGSCFPARAITDDCPSKDRPDPPESTFPDLSARQREVLALLSMGRSNKEIGRALDLAESTVKVHVSAIFQALNVGNRTEAAFRVSELS